MRKMVLALALMAAAAPAMAQPLALSDDALDQVTAGFTLGVGGTTLTFTNYDVINVDLTGTTTVTSTI